MADSIQINPAPGTWVLRAGDAVLGESQNAVALTEGNQAPVIYIPRADIAMVFLESSATQTECSLKGQASYFSIVTPAGTITDALWSYEVPPETLSDLAGHLACCTDKVTLERV